MTHRCRVVSGVVMALVMLGLPVAPVLCDLACPQAAPSAAASAIELPPSVAAAHASPPCHDSTSRDAVAVPAAPATPTTTAGLDASQVHRCEHPTVIAPRTTQSLRVPVPSLVAWGNARHASPFLVPHALLAAPAAAGAPPPPAGGAFSPVLRI